MKTLLLSVALYLIALPATFAQTSGNSQYKSNKSHINNYALTDGNPLSDRSPSSNAMIQNRNEADVEINGLMNIVADNYVAVFNIVQVGETADSTDKVMTRRINRFKKQLNQIGIDTAEITTDILSFVPNYDIQTENKIFSKSYNEVPAGFELQENVSVRYTKSSKLDEIISAAARCEIYDIVKVDYFVLNMEKLRDSLRMKCLHALKSKIKSYQVIGFKFDSLKKDMADDFNTTYPQTRYFSYQAFARPSLNALKKKSSPAPTVNEAPKTTSQYYSGINYDGYDIVINPMITEPVIQLSYTIKVKYTLNEEPKKKQPEHNNYYIITSSGEVKQFDPK